MEQLNTVQLKHHENLIERLITENKIGISRNIYFLAYHCILILAEGSLDASTIKDYFAVEPPQIYIRGVATNIFDKISYLLYLFLLKIQHDLNIARQVLYHEDKRKKDILNLENAIEELHELIGIFNVQMEAQV